MVRHQVQFVLRFGVFDEFRQLLERLSAVEQRHGWAKQRCWRASAGRVNEMVIEHEYASRDLYESERVGHHETGDEDFSATLAALAELMIPGTATETVFEDVARR